MTWRLAGMVFVFAAWTAPLRAADDDKEAKAILEKGIKALGGEEKLAKIKAYKVKTKGKLSIAGVANPFNGEAITKGLDHVRNDFEGEFGDMKVKGTIVIAGDKGWSKFGDMETTFKKGELADEKFNVLLQVIPVTLLPLKTKAFKIKKGKEEKVEGKPAVSLIVTTPGKKDFTLFFDKKTGLPVKVVAEVKDFSGGKVPQVTLLSGYKDFGGIKKSTRANSTRDGEKFLDAELTEFKVLDKVDSKLFEKPK
jgi:hypothetical protein